MNVPDRRALFIFAHQDDEYAAAPWILQELAARSSVACLYLTNGGSKVDPAIRDAESRDALQSLGVGAESIAFLEGASGRIADGELAERSLEGLAMIERWIEASGFVPQHIYAPSYEGGHPDHDATHVIAAAIAAEYGIVDEAWHFSLYNAYRRPRPFFSSLRQLPTQSQSRRTRADFGTRWSLTFLCARYRSQWRTWAGLLPGALFERAILRRESVVRFDLARIAQRPHAGELLYERMFATTYAQFAQRIAGVLRKGKF